MRDTAAVAAARTASSGFEKRAVLGLLGERSQTVPDIKADAIGQRVDGLKPRRLVARIQCRQREAGVDLMSHGGVRSRSPPAPAATRHVASSIDRSISFTAASRTATSGFARSKRATVIRSTRLSRLFVPMRVSVVPASGARRSACHRIDERRAS